MPENFNWCFSFQVPGRDEKVSAKTYDLLIVDDQAGVRRFLAEAFSEEGYRVEVACSGGEAVRKAGARRPALVLLDIKMPGMNGLETLEELRKIAPGVPVVIMTAYGELDIVTEAKKRGVKNYINKPFDLSEVRCLVKELLITGEARIISRKEIG